ncbi:non-specific lipid transfer protein GPI-anchored 4 [Euphorbia lathyris]|uniref:non-specific lipid transfer protein GPI-anchored 4 n=1 Tax=Euphorbia lathyris TaxID=212925 RepID=UPI003313BD8D
MKSLHSSAVIFAAVAVTFSSLLCTVYSQVPSPAPISGMNPSAPAPLGPPASGPAAATTDCLTPLANMSDCLGYVTEGSNSTAPDPNCCPEVAGLVDSNPICLCQLLSNSSLTESFGIKIDLSRALKLPTLCRLSTPPISTCAAVGYPIPPVASEGPMSDTSPSPSAGPSAGGPAAATIDCLTPLANMSDCLGYVTEGSNTTVPDPNCCPEVAGLVDSNPICLCQLLSNSSLTESFGIKIDLSKALKLPTICRLSTPPISTCADLGYPVPPVSSESPMAAASPSGGMSPGGLAPGGLASSPSAGGSKNGAFSISSSLQSFFVGLAFSLLLTFF